MSQKFNIIFIIIFISLNILLFPLTQKDISLVEKRINILNDKIPSDHPRILILKSEINDFKSFYNSIKNDKEFSYIFKDALFDKFNIPLIKEPSRLPEGNDFNKRKLWREAYDNAFQTAMNAQRYAFSYLLTNDEKYGREAARWLIHLSGWDINGGIDIKNNDEAFIQSLRPMIIAYDWAYDALKPDERSTIENALKTRLEILLNHITKVYSASEKLPIEKGDSHKMRFISTLGLGGLALYKELKNGPVNLSWAYEYYVNQFPVWGGNDGGYSEGLDYWATGHNQHFIFLDSMKVLGFDEIFKKEYFKNNGYFALYNIMPYPFSSFGDLCNTVEPDENTVMHIEKYALIYGDPYLMKFRDLLFKKYPAKTRYYEYSFFDSIFQIYRKKNSKIETKELSDLARSRFFKDIGWVSIHSELGNKDNDIMFGFKSSPYGSHSHSFADQNSFVINAFGEQLAISSGYREWYASPHHYGWTKTTMSKNAILFDNKGQEINNPQAKGSINNFFTSPDFDFTRGDASIAYKTEALSCDKALRSVLFVNKKYFIIFDEIENSIPLNHQWLLHAKNQMTENYQNSEVIINGKNVKLLTRFIYPDKKEFSFSQTDRFAVPVNEAYEKKMPNEWHFKLSTKKPSKTRNFITLLFPYKNDEKDIPKTSMLKSDKGFIVQCNSDGFEDMIFLANNTDMSVESSDVNFKGNCFVLSKKIDLTKILMIDGLFYKDKNFFISADNPADFEIELLKNKMIINAQSVKETVVKLKIDFDLNKISGVEKDKIIYNPSDKTVEIKITDKIKLILEN